MCNTGGCGTTGHVSLSIADKNHDNVCININDEYFDIIVEETDVKGLLILYITNIHYVILRDGFNTGRRVFKQFRTLSIFVSWTGDKTICNKQARYRH